MARPKATQKVRFRSSIGGHRFDTDGRKVGVYVYNPREEVDLDKDEAERLKNKDIVIFIDDQE